MFPESLYFREIQDVTIIKTIFTSVKPIVPLYASVSNCKAVADIPGSHFVKALSDLL
jgi:hypothetical protein